MTNYLEGCSALTISGCNSLLVSGGIEGQIRVWKLEANQQSLLAVLKEHTAPVASLQFNCFDREIVSSSSDGTCIIWDLRYVFIHIIFLFRKTEYILNFKVEWHESMC